MHQYSAQQGYATDWHIMNAGRYAAGGAGLVMLESSKIERRGCGTVGDLGLWDDAFVPGLTRIVNLVHQCGAAAGIQLGHSGRKSRVQRPWEGSAGQACQTHGVDVIDLVALAREMLYHPNWAMDAAQKLGLDPQFTMLPPPYQYWLERRAATVAQVHPSTFAAAPGDPQG